MCVTGTQPHYLDEKASHLYKSVTLSRYFLSEIFLPQTLFKKYVTLCCKVMLHIKSICSYIIKQYKIITCKLYQREGVQFASFLIIIIVSTVSTFSLNRLQMSKMHSGRMEA